jgi:hypothetical protein
VADGHDEPGDRWQQLIGSFDPERNLRAAASMFSQAASASERLLESIGDDTHGAGRRFGLRDARAELERSFDQFATAAKRLLFEFPFGGTANDSPAVGARVAVVDGVGTTVVEVPGAGAEVRCGPLLRHDGALLDAHVVTIVRSVMFDSDKPTFVVRVDVPAGTAPGTYHGQIVADGLPELALALKVTVVGDAV